MKISKYVEFGSAEVNIHIDIEDIKNIFNETPECQSDLFTAITNFYHLLEAAPDELIKRMNEKQKKVVFDFLIKQAERFKE